MSTTRVTLTLEEDLLRQARAASHGNLSRFVGQVLEEHLKESRRRKLREDLIAGCLEKAEEDLQVCDEWRFLDAEALPQEET